MFPPLPEREGFPHAFLMIEEEDKVEYYVNRFEQFLRGLTYIMSTGKGLMIHAEHDVVYAGDYSSMTQEEKTEMVRLGWVASTHDDCWVFFT